MADRTSRPAGGAGNQNQPSRPRGLAALAAAAGVVIATAVIVPLATIGHQSGTATALVGQESGGCASQSHPANVAYSGAPAGSITVCPGRAPVGALVHITLQGCNAASYPPAALVFVGPSSFIGSGGAGDPVRFEMTGGDRATATFAIPATYTAGESRAIPNRILPVRPGGHYAFATYPAGICSVPFTVTDGIRNLVISSAVRSELTAAYVAYKRILPSDVAGTRPGSVHYAYDPATDTYWALANFMPSKTASPMVDVGFQDGVSWGFFTKVRSGPWRAEEGGEPVACLEVWFFPLAVLNAWSLPTDTATSGC